MLKANIRVRVAVAKAGIRYSDLADTLGISRYTLSTKLKYELDSKVQREMIEAVERTKARLAE